MRTCAWLVALLLCAGCGYRFEGPSEDAKISLYIPPVKGDIQGQFVAQLASALTRASLIDYSEQEGAFALEITLLTDGDERIGFRYDRDPISGKLRENIVGVENRRAVAVEIQLVDTRSHKVLFGPHVVRQTLDIDYVDPNSIRDLVFITPAGEPETVLNFSLGQLDSADGARDDTTAPLYHLLAEQIADLLAHHFR